MTGFKEWFGQDRSLLDEGVLVARHEIEYIAPLTFRHAPIAVEMWVTKMGGAGFDIGYDVRDPEDVGNGHYARAETSLVVYDFAAVPAAPDPPGREGDPRGAARCSGSLPVAGAVTPERPDRPRRRPGVCRPAHLRRAGPAARRGRGGAAPGRRHRARRLRRRAARAGADGRRGGGRAADDAAGPPDDPRRDGRAGGGRRPARPGHRGRARAATGHGADGVGGDDAAARRLGAGRVGRRGSAGRRGASGDRRGGPGGAGRVRAVRR